MKKILFGGYIILNFKYLYISNNYYLSGLMSTKYLSSLLIIIKFLAKFLHLFYITFSYL